MDQRRCAAHAMRVTKQCRKRSRSIPDPGLSFYVRINNRQQDPGSWASLTFGSGDRQAPTQQQSPLITRPITHQLPFTDHVDGTLREKWPAVLFLVPGRHHSFQIIAGRSCSRMYWRPNILPSAPRPLARNTSVNVNAVESLTHQAQSGAIRISAMQSDALGDLRGPH